eukprot:1141300-Pelagomonas_calceolata.AAC.1
MRMLSVPSIACKWGLPSPACGTSLLGIARTVHHCNTVLQCIIATLSYSASLQQCPTVHHCNNVLQCIIATMPYSASLQQCPTVNSLQRSLPRPI